tara:strand:+ start:89 stop:811 length:723 start_codon:yes stop_codon:yes gene_type:complete
MPSLYELKYLKYKKKYNSLIKNLSGGANSEVLTRPLTRDDCKLLKKKTHCLGTSDVTASLAGQCYWKKNSRACAKKPLRNSNPKIKLDGDHVHRHKHGNKEHVHGHEHKKKIYKDMVSHKKRDKHGNHKHQRESRTGSRLSTKKTNKLSHIHTHKHGVHKAPHTHGHTHKGKNGKVYLNKDMHNKHDPHSHQKGHPVRPGDNLRFMGQMLSNSSMSPTSSNTFPTFPGSANIPQFMEPVD